MPMLCLFDLGQGTDVEFEGLVVLALDLKFGLEFLDEQFEARDFGAEFVNVRSRCALAMGLRCVL